MCYYAFVRYQCGCAPLEPALVPTGLTCPAVCLERAAPEVNYGNYKYLSYNCNDCQVTCAMNGRPRAEQAFRPAVLPRGPVPRSGRPAPNSAVRVPSNFVDLGDGQFRRKTYEEKKEDQRIAWRAEWAEAARRRQPEREAEEEEERRRVAKDGKKGGRK